MASMSTLNPIRVYINVSEQEYLKVAEKVRHAYQESGEYGKRTPTLELFLSDGTVYPHKGSFFLADRQVDVKTGTIRVGRDFPTLTICFAPDSSGECGPLHKPKRERFWFPNAR